MKSTQSLGLLMVLLLTAGESQGQWTGALPGGGANAHGGQLYLAEDGSTPPVNGVPDPAYSRGAGEMSTVPPDMVTAGDMSNAYPTPDIRFTPEGCTGPCPADADGYCCPPCWYLESGFRFQARNRPDRVTLSRRYIDVPGVGLVFAGRPLHTKYESFDGELGESLALGRFLGTDDSNRNQFVEMRYWATHDWETDSLASAVAPETLYGTFTMNFAGFSEASVHRYEYDSSIYNFEANYWLRPRGRPDRLVLYPNGCWRRERNTQVILSYMFGLRYISLNEDFDFRGESDGVIDDVPFEGLGRYSIAADNNMFGFQIGADLLQHGRNWSWGLQAKAAPLINVSEQGSLFRADGDPRFLSGNVSWTDDNAEVAFLGEFGAIGKFFITPNVTVFASYDLAWLFGVALAAEQFQRQIPVGTTPEIRDEGTVFMHGLTMGMQFQF